MIKRITQKEIDFQKYNHCLENSLQKNFYAKKEILDFLAESWELLVYGDYEFVMPIPITKKFRFSIVVMPLFCQQLGVFSKEKNEKIELLFLDFLMKNYRVLTYSFNFQNLETENLNKKKNYFIEKTDYQLLRKNYFKGRKSTVKVAQYLHFKELLLSETLDFITTNFKGLDKQSDLDHFVEYLKFLNEKKQLKIFGSFKENHLTNLAILIDHENRLSLLGLINKEEFKTDNGASFLIDKILQENIHEKSFDFMGGSIRGIEVFFKSFGSECQEYPAIMISKKELIKNFFKK